MTALTVTVCGVTVRSKTSERAVQAEPKSVECTSLRTSAPRLDVAVLAEYSAAIDIRSDLAVSSSRLQLAGNASGAASMALPRWRLDAGLRRLGASTWRCLDAGAASMPALPRWRLEAPTQTIATRAQAIPSARGCYPLSSRARSNRARGARVHARLHRARGGGGRGTLG
jgi:hypothetical protein